MVVYAVAKLMLFGWEEEEAKGTLDHTKKKNFGMIKEA